MSELELDALIAQVSADIEREKEFLTQSGLRVGLDESLLRDLRRLNAMRDPIAKLPVEISTEIFLQCVDRYPVELEWRSAPMLLLNVCHARTDIATSIPRLWAELDIHLPRSRPERFPELLQRWLQWASNRPLKISLQGYVESRVISVLWLHSQRLTSLRIHFTKVTVDDYYEDGHYNVLGGMIPRNRFCVFESCRLSAGAQSKCRGARSSHCCVFAQTSLI
ncbi:hypothetical protein FB45DRAFT_5476 [Roridomyces roridus]|uniref:Uncharacterized protein n=1 Tax=Roridomyces roridus TaxID=1738132 RepID=A0AAD7CI95_9AGAR|nr:hypothetical protein FB45DRAFT_5476 [Roridomyces roridus]